MSVRIQGWSVVMIFKMTIEKSATQVTIYY